MASEQDKKARVTITIPDELLEKVDKYAQREYTNRSQWIIYAILEKIRKLDSIIDKQKEQENDLP